MQVNARILNDAEREISTCKARYLAAVRAFNYARNQNAAVDEQIELLCDFRDRGIAFFNCVESYVRKSELLGWHRNELAAKDLANTAIAVLDNILRFYLKIWHEDERLGMPRLQPSPNAYYAMQSLVANLNRDEAEELMVKFDRMGLPVQGFKYAAKLKITYENWERKMMIVCGSAFVLVMLLIAVFKHDYTSEGFFIIRVIVSVFAASFTAAFVPGLLQIVIGFKSTKIRAAGSLAVLVIVYLLNPPEMVRQKRPVNPPRPPANAREIH